MQDICATQAHSTLRSTEGKTHFSSFFSRTLKVERWLLNVLETYKGATLGHPSS